VLEGEHVVAGLTVKAAGRAGERQAVSRAEAAAVVAREHIMGSGSGVIDVVTPLAPVAERRAGVYLTDAEDSKVRHPVRRVKAGELGSVESHDAMLSLKEVMSSGSDDSLPRF
jgi:hypothetical protein